MKQLLTRIFSSLAVLLVSAGLALAAEPAKTAPKAPTKAEAAKPTETKSAPAKKELVDINSASDAELKAIPGIGDTYASKIILGRPYANKTHLKSSGILPDKVYEQVKDKIIAKQPKKDDKAKPASKPQTKPEPKKK